MAIYKENIIRIDLEKGNIKRTFCSHAIGMMDQQADHFGVEIYRDGEPVELTGVTCQGVFMPPVGDPIAITGSTYTAVDGNRAEVILPQACYNYDGPFTLAIKLVDSTNSVTGTMRIVDGVVDNTHASGTVAPTGAVPTYQEVLSVYDDMVGALADYEETVEEQNAEIAEIKEVLKVSANDVVQTQVWEQGGIRSSDGAASGTASNRIRDLTYYYADVYFNVNATNDLKYCVAQYSSNATSSFTGVFWLWLDGENNFPGGFYYRVCAAYKTADPTDPAILPAAGTGITVTLYNETDPTLTKDRKAADAKVTGEAVADFNTFREKLFDNDSFEEQFGYAIRSGGIDSSTGAGTSSSTRARSYSFIKIWKQLKINVPTGMEMIIAYYESDVATSYLYMTTWATGTVRVLPYGNYCRLLFRFANNASISPSDFVDGKVVVTHFRGTDLQQDEIEKIMGLTGFIDPGDVVQGVMNNHGSVQTSTKTITFSKPIYVGTGNVIGVKLAKGWDYSVLVGTETKLRFKARHTNKGTIVADGDYIGINMTKIDPDNEGEYLDITPSDYTPYVLSIYTSDEDSIDDGYVYDPPKSLGAYNCVMRAKQLASIQYRTEAILPNQKADVASGKDVTGIPYSSTRYENLYVPNCVSFDSFMTAAMNPNSYLYTRLSTTGDGETLLGNSKTYYGAVCSTLVSYCLGFDGIIPTTHQLSYMDGFIKLPEEDQNCYGLELGDVILHKDDHIVIVTEIARTKKGKIVYVEITEAWPPFCHSVKYTPAQMDSRYFKNPEKEDYSAYRYNGLKNVTYTPSPWVNLDDETGNPTYNETMIPRRGDKAVWLPEESVEIDIMDVGDYTHYKLYKDDVLVATETFSGTLITLSDLEYGSYKLCLTDGEDDSDFVYWIVIDEPQISVEYLGNKTVRATFSCNNAEATSIAWCRTGTGNNYRHTYAVFDTTLLTEEEKNAGVVENTYSGTDWDTIVSADNGKWYIRFMWKTAFGYYSRNYALLEVE